MAGNKQYRRGRQKEWDVIKELEAKGYIAVRSAGSHGYWDVCAIKDNIDYFIQVKREKNRGQAIRPGDYLKDINQLKQLVIPESYRQIQLWIWLDRSGWYIYQIKLNDVQLLQKP